MPDDGFADEPTGGKPLRERLEESLRVNKALEARVLASEAKDIISSNGFKHVKPEDLAGVSLADLVTKATELEAAKVAQRSEVLKSVLSEKGLSDDEIEGALATLLGPPAVDHDVESLNLLKQVQKVAGSPAPRAEADLFGEDRILAQLEKNAAKAKARR